MSDALVAFLKERIIELERRNSQHVIAFDELARENVELESFAAVIRRTHTHSVPNEPCNICAAMIALDASVARHRERQGKDGAD